MLGFNVDTTLRRDRIVRSDQGLLGGLRQVAVQIAPFSIVALSLLGFFFTVAFEIFILLGLYISLAHTSRPWPLLPQAKPGVKTSDSISLFTTGWDIHANRPVWLSDSQVRTHVLLIGTTGSGKTEFLLFLSACSLAVGGGFIFIDGKADVKTWWRLVSIATRMLLEETLRIINFGTNIKQGRSKYTLTNCINIFSTADKHQLSEVMSALMPKSGGDNQIWASLAEGFMRSLLFALVDKRDAGKIELSSSTITDWMALNKYAELESDPDISEESRLEVKRYLDNLSGYREGVAGAQAGKAEAAKYHSFSTMQFSSLLNLFNVVYKHILASPVGEIKMLDVLLKRRGLYVMLPSVSKAESTIRDLGKLLVAQIRDALAMTLGNAAQGTYQEVLASRPTTSETPFICILDEYGAYAIAGFADVAAQARSLGFCAVFCSQDWASFEKADSTGVEAKRILGNTNVKIFLKIEESEQTINLVRNRTLKGYILQSAGREGEDGMLAGDREQNHASYHEVDRLDIHDLFRLKNGLHYLVFEDKLFKVQAPYLDAKHGPWKDLQRIQINHMVPVYAPTLEELKNQVHLIKKMDEFINGNMEHTETQPQTALGPALREVLTNATNKYLLAAEKNNLSPAQAGAFLTRAMMMEGLSLAQRMSSATMKSAPPPRPTLPSSELPSIGNRPTTDRAAPQAQTAEPSANATRPASVPRPGSSQNTAKAASNFNPNVSITYPTETIVSSLPQRKASQYVAEAKHIASAGEGSMLDSLVEKFNRKTTVDD